jgi:hypothetical protein
VAQISFKVVDDSNNDSLWDVDVDAYSATAALHDAHRNKEQDKQTLGIRRRRSESVYGGPKDDCTLNSRGDRWIGGDDARDKYLDPMYVSCVARPRASEPHLQPVRA